MSQSEPVYLSVSGAAAMLAVSIEYVAELIEAGEISYGWIDGRKLLTYEDVLAYKARRDRA